MSEEHEERTDLIAFGGGIKSLDNGRIGGYLVTFTSADQPDLEGDYFDADTDFGIEPGGKTAVWFNHRQPISTKDGKTISVKSRIGEGTLTPDERGIFIEAVLYEREQYEELLDKMGWSSGTASHLVDREPVGKAYHIKTWPLGLDASITPGPAEPRNAVVPLKALVQDGNQEAKAEEAASEAASAEATDAEPVQAEHIETDKQTEDTMTEEVKKTEAQSQDYSGLASMIVDGLNTTMADSMIKAMQAYADSQQPKAKGAFSVKDALDELEGTKSFGDWLLAVSRGDSKRLKEVYNSTKDLVEGTGTAGGYLVPEEFLNELVRVDDPYAEVVYPRARKIPGQRRSLRVPVLDQTGTPAANYKIEYYGGVYAHWTEEAGAKTEVEPSFKQLELVAHKLAGYTQASDELLADSAQSLDSLLRSLFAGAVRFRRDYAYLRGTGIGQPLGILNSAALIAELRDVANQISANDLHSMMSRFLPTSIGNPSTMWVASPGTMEQLLALGDGTNYIWQPDAQAGIPMYLYGIPLMFSEKLPWLGTQGDILLADFSYYYIYDRGGLAIDVSQHYAFVNDLTTWRFVYRTDGQPSLSDPLYIDTTHTVSPFVVLAATTD